MPTQTLRPIIQSFPYHTDLAPELADHIIKKHQESLPALDNVIVLMPNYHASTRVREALTSAAANLGFKTLLGPQVYTLKDYIEKNTLLDKQRIPSESRELILIQALEENRNLFGEQNLLTVAYSLLELFDELTRHQINLPENLDDFISQLESAYTCDDTKIQALSHEATIVHTLWKAWHTQLQAENITDLETHYQLKLHKNLSQTCNEQFYIAGYYEFLPSEIQWVNHQLEQNNASLFFHGESHDYGFHPATTLYTLFNKLDVTPSILEEQNSASQFLNAVYDNRAQFQDRAKKLKKEIKESPVTNHISTFEGRSFEEEAKAIDLQVRAWMAAKIKHIALIIEDRMLARRVRALLEQSGIGLKDMEGWALSTSSAASIIESWLQTIEENFHHLPLLDVIKSPFSLQNIEIKDETVYRFEQDIIHHENISSDLTRYHKACVFRQHRLNKYNTETFKNITELLDHIKQAAAPLSHKQHKKHKLSDFLYSLKNSLELLGCMPALNNDIAGEAIVKLISTLIDSVKICDIKTDWLGFRHWLGNKLEETTFKPENSCLHYVELLHLAQSSLGNYDALIIASMTRDVYPGMPKQTPFFNQSVRAELNLPGTQAQSLNKFYHFRRLLASAPNVLLTMHSGPQENLASPWFSLLENFHKICYDSSLANNDIRQWIDQAETLYEMLPQKKSDTAVIHQQHLPESLSASAHQTIINCPYAFFAAQVLHLRAPDEIRDTLAKSDYGERVHLCLQAFHAGDIKDLPGPYKNKITQENRDEAIAFLNLISDKVFSQDIEDNFQHRGWLNRWQVQIPKYIDWEINRERVWQFDTGEGLATKKLLNNYKIHGRIDRLDRSIDSGNKLGIIDYKTGNTPKPIDVTLGEAVQLAHYALASDEAVTQIEYLQLADSSKKQVVSQCTLTDEDLQEIKAFTEKRLVDIYQKAEQGHVFEAWGTDSNCQYCMFTGLCRKQFNH